MQLAASLAQQFRRTPYDPALWLQMARTAAETSTQHAIGIYEALCDAAPNHYTAFYELGLCYERQGDWPQALHAFNVAATISKGKEGHGIALASLGAVAYRMGFPKDGQRYYAKALQHPDNRPYARWARALIRLAQGDWKRGWRDYEARWEVPQLARTVEQHGIDPQSLPPRWDGGSTDGPVLVYAEQGTGDCIWALRYLPHVERASGHGHVPSLPIAIAAIADRVHPSSELCPVASIPVMSLPHVLNMPEPIGPQVHRHHTTKGTKRIGYCYKGERAHGNDRDRSSPVSFASYLTEAGYEPVSLQYGEPHTFRDYAETADLMATCDAVLTVDTSVAHLAGTLGVPTVVIPPTVPDWRWPGTGTTTPWYPSVHVTRRHDASDPSWDAAIRQAVGVLA